MSTNHRPSKDDHNQDDEAKTRIRSEEELKELLKLWLAQCKDNSRDLCEYKLHISQSQPDSDEKLQLIIQLRINFLQECIAKLNSLHRTLNAFWLKFENISAEFKEYEKMVESYNSELEEAVKAHNSELYTKIKLSNHGVEFSEVIISADIRITRGLTPIPLSIHKPSSSYSIGQTAAWGLLGGVLVAGFAAANVFLLGAPLIVLGVAAAGAAVFGAGVVGTTDYFEQKRMQKWVQIHPEEKPSFYTKHKMKLKALLALTALGTLFLGGLGLATALGITQAVSTSAGIAICGTGLTTGLVSATLTVTPIHHLGDPDDKAEAERIVAADNAKIEQRKADEQKRIDDFEKRLAAKKAAELESKSGMAQKSEVASNLPIAEHKPQNAGNNPATEPSSQGTKTQETQTKQIGDQLKNGAAPAERNTRSDKQKENPKSTKGDDVAKKVDDVAEEQSSRVYTKPRSNSGTKPTNAGSAPIAIPGAKKTPEPTEAEARANARNSYQGHSFPLSQSFGSPCSLDILGELGETELANSKEARNGHPHARVGDGDGRIRCNLL